MINSFALVTYIPDPLGSFLDRLRNELAPGVAVQAHVTVLPPRPLQVDASDAWRQIQVLAKEFSTFVLELSTIEIFPVTNVIYLALGEGSARLRCMNEAFNRDGLAFQEQFLYEPHVTLAQELDPSQIREAFEIAVNRWKEFRHKRSFQAEKLTLVQSTRDRKWIDLAAHSLAGSESVVAEQ